MSGYDINSSREYIVSTTKWRENTYCYCFSFHTKIRQVAWIYSCLGYITWFMGQGVKGCPCTLLAYITCLRLRELATLLEHKELAVNLWTQLSWGGDIECKMYCSSLGDGWHERWSATHKTLMLKCWSILRPISTPCSTWLSKPYAPHPPQTPNTLLGDMTKYLDVRYLLVNAEHVAKCYHCLKIEIKKIDGCDKFLSFYSILHCNQSDVDCIRRICG